jgi:hypothetical protein
MSFTNFKLKLLELLSTLYATIIAHCIFYSLVPRFLLRIPKGIAAPGFKLPSPNFAGHTIGRSSRSFMSYRSAISAADRIIAFFARNRPRHIAWSPKYLVSFDALEIRLLILTTVRNSQSLESIQIEGSFVILYLLCRSILSSRPHGGLHRATDRIMHIRNKPIRPEPVYGALAILRIPEALVHMRDSRVHQRDFSFGKLPSLGKCLYAGNRLRSMFSRTFAGFRRRWREGVGLWSGYRG